MGVDDLDKSPYRLGNFSPTILKYHVIVILVKQIKRATGIGERKRMEKNRTKSVETTWRNGIAEQSVSLQFVIRALCLYIILYDEIRVLHLCAYSV